MRALAFGLVLIATELVAAQPVPPAPAPVPDGPVDDDEPWARGVSIEKRQAAEAEFLKGIEQFSKLRYTVALAAFEQALGHWDNPQIHYNAALCLMHLDRVLEAYSSLERALAYGAKPFVPASLHDTAQLHKKNLRARLAEVSIAVDEAGAQITLDGEAIEPNVKRLLVAGNHALVVSKPGFVTQTRTLDLDGGSEQELKIDLEPPGASIVKRRWASWIPWTVAAGGVVVAGVGGMFHVRALGHFSDYEDRLAMEHPMGETEENLDESITSVLRTAELERVLAISAYVLGGAAIATGVVMVILNRGELVDPSGTQVITTTTSDSYGIAVRGRF